MKVLAKFFWDCGRSGEINGLFIAEKAAIDAAIGKYVYLGEVLGKHSEVYGNINEEDITIVSEDQTIVELLLNLFEDGTISGFNPLEYIEESDDEDNDESEEQA